ncbi:MAG: hypothetical protein D3910_07280, partial [Candidatus Electrothrix sp. ATG2]|nr:hypothetical protein [Candidatus Electrothrix sp. ATG2]
MNVEFPITLYVNGLIISGILTNGYNFFEEGVKKHFSNIEQKDPDLSEAQKATHQKIAESIISYKEEYKTTDEDDENKEKDEYIEIKYIHLRSATICHSGQIIPQNGTWWRGLLSSVNAFNLGIFNITTENNPTLKQKTLT